MSVGSQDRAGGMYLAASVKSVALFHEFSMLNDATSLRLFLYDLTSEEIRSSFAGDLGCTVQPVPT